MARGPRLYIVTYDISSPSRLRQVYKTMRGFGDHLQYSVFRCILSDRQMVRLRSALESVIDPGEDQVLFIPLGPAHKKKAWGMFTLGRKLVHADRVVRIL